MTFISAIKTSDVRFPTSIDLDGSDAVNTNPDHSAAYLTLLTDDPEWPVGHAFVFTGGRGNDLMCRAIETVAELLPAKPVEWMLERLGEVSQNLIHDSQLRWLGPEKGVTHMAAGAVINALWDIRARRAGLPLWQLLAEMTPRELVSVIDFSHIRDALTESQALEILEAGQHGKAERIAELKATGYPAYTTGPGWLGYSDDKMQRLAAQAVADGFSMVKLKVGGELIDDRHRLELARKTIGENVALAIDANQRWEADGAAAWINELAEFDIHWVEEPTSPDDVLGHARIRQEIAPIPVATGEAAHNRIMVKQLLQAEAIDYLQIDATRVAGTSENLANLLLAARFGVPVCPHAGGIGLCELVQHFSFFDYAVVSQTRENRMIEFVDHLHEHMATPVRLNQGRYEAPSQPGTGAEIKPDSVTKWTYPVGAGWQRQQGSLRATNEN
ncbi:enolase C-terminal domain-like protein [Spelaeicoccus albus]|uniref:L-fuconate dehydratase n=1 Tax=Spelaeicoccus albus TaxID=1280376 RepID=A0A7Z0D4J6_9MICO|nr:enolase C-terminal domain-like protein [Spelaeicoccus albus]NYI68762.1 L-fuconate dehydratase [Spelaeicoccus albus]